MKYSSFKIGMLILAAALALAGCANKNSSEKQSDRIVPEAPPSEFDNAANRPPNARTLYSLARILAIQGKDRECANVLSRCINQFPDFLPAYNDLAELYLRAGRTDDAVVVLQAGLRQSPNDPVLNNNLGMCRMMQDDYMQALDCFRKAEAAAPRNQTYAANKAAALAMLGRDAEAREVYRQILVPADTAQNMKILAQARELKSAQESSEAPSDAPATQPVETD